MAATFGLTLLAWVFFRADSVGHAMRYLSEIFSKSFFSMPSFAGSKSALVVVLMIVFFLFIEWNGREDKFAIEKTGAKWPKLLRWVWYALIISLIGLLAQTVETPFIYFQF